LIKGRNKEMKRFFILFMAVILSSFVLIGCGSDQNAETISQLQATVDDLQNQVREYSALKTELDSANNSIAELQSQMDALTAEKEEMSSKLEILYKIEPVDETMYTIADADIYDDLYGEALGNEPTGNIPAEQEIKITGKSVAVDWYEIEMDGKKQYVSAKLVSRTKPQPQSSSGSSGGSGNTTTQQPSGGGQPSSGGSGGGNGGSGGGTPPADDGDVTGGALSGLPEWGAGGLGDTDIHWDIE
jgi:outer membrane murein-binding lipoprotein Lpp